MKNYKGAHIGYLVSINSSPSIGFDGTIYIGASDYNLYAINPGGSLKWKYKTDNKINSSPAIGKNGFIYIGSDDNYLYSISAEIQGENSPWPMFKCNKKRNGNIFQYV